ncbi:MAG: bifunctional folylpolyglutamate synthase/dihydrofolate synthase [Bacillota bacterium]|jgi:dihydrofolate synthase/folylpolyglutamate synthase
MNYQESMHLLQELTKFGINQGLTRVEELLRRLGNPHKSGLKFAHIAGTNGKGSVSAMLASIFSEAGYKTGFFSSPHLHSYRERYRIDGRMIDEEEVAALLTEISTHISEMVAQGFESPTEFEVSTALALLCFARRKVDWAVIETGLGGSIDSTNVIDSQLAVITNVGIDHRNYLGDTIAEIAAVKAGIIKEGSVVVTGAEGEALRIIEEKACLMNAPISVLPRDFCYYAQNYSLRPDNLGQTFTVITQQAVYKDLFLPLLGQYQLANAALAVLAAEKMGLGQAAIARGLANTDWPGRLEILSQKPLVVMDGAHNSHGMAALAACLQQYWPEKKIVAVMGMLADKDRREALARILPQLAHLIITKPPSQRAGDWQYLADLALEYGLPTEREADITVACDKALQKLDDDGLLLVCGSLYLLADARKWLLERNVDAKKRRG